MRPETQQPITQSQTLQQGAGPSRNYHFTRRKTANWDEEPLEKMVYENEREEATIRQVFNRIDRRGNGKITRFELAQTMARDAGVCEFFLPKTDLRRFFDDEQTFNGVLAVIDFIFGGKQSVKYSEFTAKYKRPAQAGGTADKLQAVFDMIDVDSNGSVSKRDFLYACQHNQTVGEFLLPGIDSSDLMSDEWSFDKVDALFHAIAGDRDKKTINFTEFSKYFNKGHEPKAKPRGRTDRAQNRVFIVGPGFGMKLNQRQCEVLEDADYELYWCIDVPNPDTENFNVSLYLGRLKEQIDAFQPDILAVASKGGLYAVALWQMGFWRGPTLFINCHPSLRKLPPGMPVVLAHGSNDEIYPTSRADLEALMATGTPNKCFLYYSANSGQLASGQYARLGDKHDMDSLVQHDLLPRLIDAALCPDGAELYILRTWRERLTEVRLEAEEQLGYTPDDLHAIAEKSESRASRKRPSIHKGINVLFDVSPESKEWQLVSTVFKATPKEPPAYMMPPKELWEQTTILRIERVKNKLQLNGSTKPYFRNVQDSLEEQGIDFEPGVHTMWGFHGANAEALESIVTNPVAGFQPLASGSKGASLWGSGVYFGRDAQYVAKGGSFCQPREDGTRQMLMCLLTVGHPCLGDPGHKGVLPFRDKPHRYNATCDSMSSPEILILQHSGAAYPAYLITFKDPVS